MIVHNEGTLERETDRFGEPGASQSAPQHSSHYEPRAFVVRSRLRQRGGLVGLITAGPIWKQMPIAFSCGPRTASTKWCKILDFPCRRVGARTVRCTELGEAKEQTFKIAAVSKDS